MISVEPTTDDAYIASVMKTPGVYEGMADDSCPEAGKLDMAGMKSIPGFVLRVLIDGAAGGLFWLIWKGADVEAHTALLENCRGRRAVVATRLAMAWVFKHTQAKTITSYAWSDSPAVAWFCRAVGMSPVTTQPWSSTRGGKSVSITYYSIPRGSIIT